ncbi:Prephenate dehydrogenase TyrA [Helicobacter ailurogastricus]|uniref:prephenate dehydrogenase n=1 Tax=Helicobacter ailurogastricus TaxID=1578720 RepID=UPI000CF086F7|nr:prephenate dehydrogenase [Helicobacter ailurogastricus]GMB89785.1 Prephenate dehydrogenase TyrA [Helicobacter ailurogastricus]GMB91539.1 Prephenate dehydrogenase TyrA [Helicobacter ailurogastricus]
MQVGIVGLGLMGGSLGLALQEVRQELGIKRILGCDSNPLHAQMALSLGLVEECVDLRALQDCAVVFLATPLDGIIQILQSFKPSLQTTIIEIGGAKEQIINAILPAIRPQVVATHPMCGTEFYGPKAALKGLYRHKIVIFVDCEKSAPEHVERAKEIFSAIGMQLVKMDAKSHDAHIAFVSHLPHAISYALANVVLSQKSPQTILSLAAGGFKDMSRLSKSSPVMWRSVFSQNTKQVLKAMDAFLEEMHGVRALLENQEWDALQKWMGRANKLQEFM